MNDIYDCSDLEVTQMDFDLNRAKLSDKAKFKPFNVKEFISAEILLKTGRLNKDVGVLIMTLNGQAYGFLTKQMIYHHVANGTVDGYPFMISF